LILFFPPRLCETTVLEECVGDHGHEGMTMQALPGSSLEVIEPEFLFQLLMGLFDRPNGRERLPFLLPKLAFDPSF
jgi:hypothetical protein